MNIKLEKRNRIIAISLLAIAIVIGAAMYIYYEIKSMIDYQLVIKDIPTGVQIRTTQSGYTTPVVSLEIYEVEPYRTIIIFSRKNDKSFLEHFEITEGFNRFDGKTLDGYHKHYGVELDYHFKTDTPYGIKVSWGNKEAKDTFFIQKN